MNKILPEPSKLQLKCIKCFYKLATRRPLVHNPTSPSLNSCAVRNIPRTVVGVAMFSSAADLQGAGTKLTVSDSLKKYLSSRRGSGAPPALSESDLTQEEKV